jgi:hypothetical protein
MKVLMKEVGGNGRGHKKARVWNMAQFQPRRWHREEAQDENKASSEQKDQNSFRQGAALRTPTTNSPNQITSSSIVHPVVSAPSTSATASFNETSVAPPQPHNSSVSSVKSVVNSLPQLPPVKTSRTRVGKIARLPHDLRETVNAMLRGGFAYRDIAAHLRDLGHPGITENNISFWKYHGYMDWLARQHQLESQATLVKSFEHCVRALDTDRIQQNAIGFAAEQLCQVMVQFDHRNILGLLNQKPELFPKFVESIATLTRCSKDLASAFAANQKSDTTIRSEMEKHPITESLSEPISDADFDEEEEPAATNAGSASPPDPEVIPPSPRNDIQPAPSSGVAAAKTDSPTDLRDRRAFEVKPTPNNSKLLQPTTTQSHEPALIERKRT